MELDKFIESSLVQIYRGVRQANDVLEKSFEETGTRAFWLRPGSKSTEGTGVDFDVAVTAQSTSKRGGTAKAGIKVLELSVGKEAGSTQETASRIRFTVMVAHFHA